MANNGQPKMENPAVDSLTPTEGCGIELPQANPHNHIRNLSQLCSPEAMFDFRKD